MKVTLLGAAGGIGQALALLLKDKLPAGTELALYDLNPATPGVGVDLSHIPNSVKVTAYAGDEFLEKALDKADIVAISAGVARKPGMDRSDLFNINASITQKLLNAIAKTCPKAFIGLITNPLNTTIAIAKAELQNNGVYNAKNLFGITQLDVIRSKVFVGQELDVDPAQVQLDVIGGHSGTTILPILSKFPQINPTRVAELTHRIQNAGTEVVEAKAGAGSATLSMAYAAYEIIAKLVAAKQGQKVEFHALVELPNTPTEFFAQLIEVDSSGVIKSVQNNNFSDYEQQLLKDLIPILEADLKLGKDFVANNKL